MNSEMVLWVRHSVEVMAHEISPRLASSATTIVVVPNGAYSGTKKTFYRVMFCSLRSAKV